MVRTLETLKSHGEGLSEESVQAGSKMRLKAKEMSKLKEYESESKEEDEGKVSI